jgi:hypothetical protein
MPTPSSLPILILNPPRLPRTPVALLPRSSPAPALLASLPPALTSPTLPAPATSTPLVAAAPVPRRTPPVAPPHT